jgi:hypothetical protein
VRVRQAVARQAVAQGFSLVDQTKLVTAASELARNAIEHGGGGRAEILALDEGREARPAPDRSRSRARASPTSSGACATDSPRERPRTRALRARRALERLRIESKPGEARA